MRSCRVAALAVAALVVGMLVPAASSGAVSCQYNAASKHLEITTTTPARLIRTSGVNVTVLNESNVVVACNPGGATVNNTDSITVDDQALPGVDNSAIIDLGGGPFAPGATDESGSNDEIEIDVKNVESVEVDGTGGVEDIRFGTNGANLNAGSEGGILTPGRDVDVTFTGTNLVGVFGFGSNDVLRGDGGLATGSPFPRSLFLLGEAGDDQLTGGDHRDALGAFAGEPGNDELSGGAAPDYLGADIGNDTVTGGPGEDSASYVEINSIGGVVVDLAKTGPQDTGGGGLDTLTEVEDLQGSPFVDTLSGDGGANRLDGEGGNDTLDPRGGADFVFAGAGNDALAIRDGGPDTANCGPDADTVTADLSGIDTIEADCETIDFAAFVPTPDGGGGGGAGGGSDSRVDVSLSARRRQEVLDPNGLVVRARCPDEDCEAKARAIIRLPERSARSPRASVRAVKSRAVRESLDAGEAEKLRLLLPRKGAKLTRAALDQRSGLPAVVRIAATDAADNRGTASARVKVVG